MEFLPFITINSFLQQASMFNQQQKPAFKFVIRSKLEDEKQTQEESRDKNPVNAITKKQPSESTTVEDRKRKRSDKDSAPPIATKKVVILFYT
jgi:hypothetical protein